MVGLLAFIERTFGDEELLTDVSKSVEGRREQHKQVTLELGWHSTESIAQTGLS